MSALAILNRHRKPLTSMSDIELDAEHDFWTGEKSCRDRWGDPVDVADEHLAEIAREQRRRRVIGTRAGDVYVHPFIVDDPGIRQHDLSIEGAGKSRAEWRPSRRMLIGAVSLLLVIFVSAAALAGQRLVELDNHFARDIV